jgi:hypothetical protein
VIAVGDAALARDAIASQGLSIGLSDALHVATADNTEVMSHRVADARAAHVRMLAKVLDDVRFGAAPAWADYRGWLTRNDTLERGSV